MPPTVAGAVHAAITGCMVHDPDGDPNRGWRAAPQADAIGRGDAEMAAMVFEGRLDELAAGDEACQRIADEEMEPW